VVKDVAKSVVRPNYRAATNILTKIRNFGDLATCSRDLKVT